MVAHNAPHAGNEGAPLQAPPEDVRAMRHVESPERRMFAGKFYSLEKTLLAHTVNKNCFCVVQRISHASTSVMLYNRIYLIVNGK